MIGFIVYLFLFLEMSLLPGICCAITALSFYGEYVVRLFLPDGVL